MSYEVLELATAILAYPCKDEGLGRNRGLERSRRDHLVLGEDEQRIASSGLNCYLSRSPQLVDLLSRAREECRGGARAGRDALDGEEVLSTCQRRRTVFNRLYLLRRRRAECELHRPREPVIRDVMLYKARVMSFVSDEKVERTDLVEGSVVEKSQLAIRTLRVNHCQHIQMVLELLFGGELAFAHRAAVSGVRKGEMLENED